MLSWAEAFRVEISPKLQAPRPPGEPPWLSPFSPAPPVRAQYAPGSMFRMRSIPRRHRHMAFSSNDCCGFASAAGHLRCSRLQHHHPDRTMRRLDLVPATTVRRRNTQAVGTRGMNSAPWAMLSRSCSAHLASPLRRRGAALRIASLNSLLSDLAARNHNRIGEHWNRFPRIVYLHAEAKPFLNRDRRTTQRKSFRNSGSFSHPADLPGSLRKKTTQSRC